MNPTLKLPTTASTEAQLTVAAHERRISCSIAIACAPVTLYKIWADVQNWHTWDPDTKSAGLDQSFAAGSSGFITPQKGMTVKMQIIQAAADQSFTALCRVLGNRMIFVHTLQETRQGIIATHQVQFQGWLAGLLMRTVGQDVCKGLPLTMTRLKHVCEAAQCLK
jgi:hypothetical protein